MLTQRQIQQLKSEVTPYHIQAEWIHKVLEAYPVKEHHGTWHQRGRCYFYRHEYSLGTWLEIDGDTIRSCMTDSADGGSWGFDKEGKFYVTCVYRETTERLDLIAKVKQLHLMKMQSTPPGKKGRNAYLEAKGR